jgi:hypothetical protein
MDTNKRAYVDDEAAKEVGSVFVLRASIID